MRPDAGAVLVPAVNTTAWEQGIGCRIVLFRDWPRQDDDGKKKNDQLRIAQVIKAEGVLQSASSDKRVGFGIDETGFYSITLSAVDLAHLGSSPPQPAARMSLPQKRKLSTTALEIPDSDAEDDEDYGWAEEDEEDVPAMPPQWQGSEDILIPAPGELEAERDEVQEEEEAEEAVE